MDFSLPDIVGKKKIVDEIDSLNQKAYSISNTDPSKSRKLVLKAKAMAEDCDYSKGIAMALHVIAMYDLRSGDLQASVKKAKDALEIFTELNDEEGMSSTLNTLGIAYRNIGSFDRGLSCLIKSLKIQSRNENRSNIVKLYGNIGNIFNNMAQYHQGLEYYMKCLQIGEEMNDESCIADAYSNMGICYQHLGENSKSIKYHNKALQTREAINDQEGISFCLNNLGVIFERQGKLKKALQYYFNSLNIKIKLCMKLETARTCCTIGSLYTVMKDYDTATHYLEKSAVIAREVNSNTALKESHYSLSTLYRTTGNFEKALKHHIAFHRIDKHVFNSTRITSMEAQLELMNSELYSTNGKLEMANAKLSKLSITDGLTGIYNRRHFDEFLRAEWARCMRRSIPISLIMIDIDFFKLFNDTYGHTIGDDCLKAVAQALDKQANRSVDLVARFGGEEFAIILSETDLAGAVKVSKRARSAIESLGIPHSKSTAAKVVSISIGVASLTPCRLTKPVELITRADKALYFSKRNGRNRITCFELNH